MRRLLEFLSQLVIAPCEMPGCYGNIFAFRFIRSYKTKERAGFDARPCIVHRQFILCRFHRAYWDTLCEDRVYQSQVASGHYKEP